MNDYFMVARKHTKERERSGSQYHLNSTDTMTQLPSNSSTDSQEMSHTDQDSGMYWQKNKKQKISSAAILHCRNSHQSSCALNQEAAVVSQAYLAPAQLILGTLIVYFISSHFSLSVEGSILSCRFSFPSSSSFISFGLKCFRVFCIWVRKHCLLEINYGWS